MKSDLEGRKKKKKDEGEEKTQKKSDPMANLRLREPQVVRPRPRETWGSREPGRATQAMRFPSL